MRYQDGIGESRACAEERDGARLMQAWENGVRARHPEDGKVASAPGGNVLDHCGMHTDMVRLVRACFRFQEIGVSVVVSLTAVSVD